MFMKLRIPFIIIKNILINIHKMHDFPYTVPNEKSDKFWDKKCINHLTSYICKIYDGVKK